MKIKTAFSFELPKRRQYGPRKSIRRDHGGAHQRLVEDYFAEEPFHISGRDARERAFSLALLSCY
nr:unnamed protein product [Digitaria exilis]